MIHQKSKAKRKARSWRARAVHPFYGFFSPLIVGGRSRTFRFLHQMINDRETATKRLPRVYLTRRGTTVHGFLNHLNRLRPIPHTIDWRPDCKLVKHRFRTLFDYSYCICFYARLLWYSVCFVSLVPCRAHWRPQVDVVEALRAGLCYCCCCVCIGLFGT